MLKVCVQMGTHQIEPFRSKNGTTKKVIRKVERYAIAPLRSPSEQANEKHVNGTIALPSEHKTKLVRSRCVPVSTAYLSAPEIGTKMERNDCAPT